MTSRTSGTFGGWADRVTFILAEAQLLVAGIAVSIGVALVWFRPSLGVPPLVRGWLAAALLLGPPLVTLFITGARKLRERRMVAVHHINGVTDVREKFYVAPEIWQEKTINGPSPYVVNDGDAYEVREFEFSEELNQLSVRGCYMSQLADSKLVTVKAMIEDVHGDLIEAFLAKNRLRARISKMGVEIQRDVINEEAEADERGLMNPKTVVRERFKEAETDAEKHATDEIQDVDEYLSEYHAEGALGEIEQRMAAADRTPEPATTDGGMPE